MDIKSAIISLVANPAGDQRGRVSGDEILIDSRFYHRWSLHDIRSCQLQVSQQLCVPRSTGVQVTANNITPWMQNNDMYIYKQQERAADETW